MARRSRPWFRVNRGWFVTIQGKQHGLGISDPQDEAAAFAALQLLMDRLRAEKATPVGLADAAARYLAGAAERVSARTMAYYRRHVDELLKRFGQSTVAELEALAVEQYAKERKWSATTRRGFLQTVEALMRAAGARDWKAVKPKKVRSQVCVSPETYWQLRGAARGDFKAYLDVLWHTGARPSEVAGLTVEGVDWDAALARLSDHKTAHRGKPRTIHFNDAAMAVLRKQREKYATGALFRNEAGRPLNAYQAGRRLWRVCERIGVEATLYGMRHSWATRALAAGVPDAHVAELLGHASTAVVHAHYSHLGQMTRALKDSLGKVG